MRIGLISDIHVPDKGPSLPFLVKQAFQGVKLILSTGDHVIASVVEELEAIAPLKAVAGNSDKYRNPDEIPEKRIIKINGHRIGLIHGWGNLDEIEKNILASFKSDSVAAIVFGHTHMPIQKNVDGILLINPGSPTFPRGGSFKSVGILYAEKDKPLRAEIVRL